MPLWSFYTWFDDLTYCAVTHFWPIVGRKVLSLVHFNLFLIFSVYTNLVLKKCFPNILRCPTENRDSWWNVCLNIKHALYKKFVLKRQIDRNFMVKNFIPRHVSLEWLWLWRNGLEKSTCFCPFFQHFFSVLASSLRFWYCNELEQLICAGMKEL